MLKTTNRYRNQLIAYRISAGLCCILLLLASPIFGQSTRATPPASCCKKPAKTSAATAQAEATPPVTVPDASLIDQHGKKVNFYSDLVKDKVVVISFIYTSCALICGPLGDHLSQLQAQLHQQGRKDIQFISISLDPESDTAEQLKAWGEHHQVRDGWALLTGDKPNVDSVLLALIGQKASKGMHSPAIIVGNASRNSWARVNGFAIADEIIEYIDEAQTGVPRNIIRESSEESTVSKTATHR